MLSRKRAERNMSRRIVAPTTQVSTIPKLGGDSSLLRYSMAKETLPDPDSKRIRPPHRLIRLDTERIVELRDIGKRTQHSPFRRRVHVTQESPAQRLITLLGHPPESVPEK